MNAQGKSSCRERVSSAALRALQSNYRALDRAVRRHAWLAQGSVNVVAPRSSSARRTYTWTRKVKAKTVTVALSSRQAAAFRLAIEANRRIEAALGRLRERSQTALLTTVPGVPKRRLAGPQESRRKSVLKGA